LRDVVGRKRPQHQHPAARPDGRQHAARRVTDQQQQRSRRRLLQHLEQGVVAFVAELIHGIDDGNTPAALPRGRSEE
jgi:hypothetical protein